MSHGFPTPRSASAGRPRWHEARLGWILLLGTKVVERICCFLFLNHKSRPQVVWWARPANRGGHKPVCHYVWWPAAQWTPQDPRIVPQGVIINYNGGLLTGKLAFASNSHLWIKKLIVVLIGVERKGTSKAFKSALITLGWWNNTIILHYNYIKYGWNGSLCYLGRGGGLFGFPHPTSVTYVTWFHFLCQNKRGISSCLLLSTKISHKNVSANKMKPD